jgi:hypothetical protein
MTAVNGIDIIEGKASLSAELMVAIVRSTATRSRAT